MAPRPRVAAPPARKAPVADDGDATVIIDWLLKARP
jgi:hypothetical protein